MSIEQRRARASRPAPSTPARSPTPRPARSSRRSRCRRRSPRTASASTRASSTRARATRPAPRSRRASPRSKAPRTASRSPAAWRPRTTSCACSRPGDRIAARQRRLRRHVPAHLQGVRARSAITWTRGRPHRPRRARRRLAATTPRMVWLETPTNPLLTCFDIEAIADGRPRARRAGASSTTPSPRRTCSSRSTLGADIVVHSATKYLGGHSDVVGGFVAVDDDDARRSRCGSPRTRPARCRRRSTATSCCAA